ncbi:MAG TPA: CRISPR locus-related DNA-binding protein [Thermoplasmatales archaeon]|nr:CRISPR locus-related DNA-binding protein [Thermoplasmatales archaeon]
MAKVLIATLYSPDPVLLAASRLGADKLILLVDKNPDEEQEKSYKLIKESLGRVVEVERVEVEVYDIVKIAEKSVEVIDNQSKNDEIFVNITAGRKTQALGLLFAAYARSNVVKKIAYNPEEDKTAVVWLPKLSFKLTESQREVLKALKNEDNTNISLKELAEKIGISRSMLYRNIEELKHMGYIEPDEIKLTDAGRIAIL